MAALYAILTPSGLPQPSTWTAKPRAMRGRTQWRHTCSWSQPWGWRNGCIGWLRSRRWRHLLGFLTFQRFKCRRYACCAWDLHFQWLHWHHEVLLTVTAFPSKSIFHFLSLSDFTQWAKVTMAALLAVLAALRLPEPRTRLTFTSPMQCCSNWHAGLTVRYLYICLLLLKLCRRQAWRGRCGTGYTSHGCHLYLFSKLHFTFRTEMTVSTFTTSHAALRLPIPSARVALHSVPPWAGRLCTSQRWELGCFRGLVTLINIISNISPQGTRCHRQFRRLASFRTGYSGWARLVLIPTQHSPCPAAQHLYLLRAGPSFSGQWGYDKSIDSKTKTKTNFMVSWFHALKLAKHDNMPQTKQG